MPNKHNKPKPSEPQPLGSATRSLSLLLCLGALAGVLIWAKLRLVTDIPRSAYADPNETALPMDPEADEPAPDALPKEGMDEPSEP